jgi:hypothetical protein
MNSDKAAAVRDAINACPGVVNESNLREDDGTPRSFGDEIQTGDRYEFDSRLEFRPARIEQSGEVGNGEGTRRPVFVVTLAQLWYVHDSAVSLSQQIVYEAAKHDCSIRVYPENHSLGPAIWFVDSVPDDLSDTDGDRCPTCNGTYYKIHDGTVECARCGTERNEASDTLLAD